MSSGVVDISGVIQSILSSYQRVLTEYQRQVTGDPGALTSAAQQHTEQAGTVGAVAGDATSRAQQLATDWHGDAYTAFRTATTQLSTDLHAVEALLRKESERLQGAANALTTAQAGAARVIEWFQQYASILVDEARTAASGAVNAFFDAATQLGESAINAARAVADQLGGSLSALFGASTVLEGAR
ncbi:hypothetical protein F0L68_01625 [Solihabitans fulvus]|uniref:WXG100 family type VII secretion target n=1 Tax=Solihabitans fulvus TaxID=1892852 RepID=A0A5B2XU65_9PSEU|nr:WXG100 family type VII secretion target [Solihabitans fulvus]KAA2266472.1 hypothetical protein F0L68_01625 [Solihabitans fulvus]